MKEVTLSIIIVTMNRSAQLEEAMLSCLKCVLPPKTEFIIIDNASTDNTASVVNNIKEEYNKYRFYYERLPENIGCGNGRNYAYKLASGMYVYALDDDAYIDESNLDFFIKAVDYFDKYKDIVTLTTQIYDLAWKGYRQATLGRSIDDNLDECFVFRGGSHFLRKSYFIDSPYFPNKYDNEEFMPSIYVEDDRKINAFAKNLRIIHNPLLNKWTENNEAQRKTMISGCATKYIMKKMLYPRIFAPFLWVTFVARSKKYLKNKEEYKTAKLICKDMYKTYHVPKRIRLSTTLRLLQKYGVTAL